LEEGMTRGNVRAVLTGVALLVAWALAVAQETPKQVKSNGSFDQLKLLAGEWEGTNGEGKRVHANYLLVSHGSVLMERLLDAGESSEMITMYSPDGSRLAMTHYCSAGNQPQMRTAPFSRSSRKFTFDFVRATNLESPNAGHMGKLVITIQDPDHFTQEWTWMEGGKPADTSILRFTRKS
jgi:hypothetical protein